MAVAVKGVRMTSIDIGFNPNTFELLCVRISSGTSSCVAAVIYRPGSADITSSFFSDLSDLLDRLATHMEPVILVGDVNIRLDRPTDTAPAQFNEIVSAHGLVNNITSATHNRGGMLDVVVTRVDLPPSCVEVIDVGLSDHRLLQWSMAFNRPIPVYMTTTCRPWSRLDTDAFRAALQSSQLCNPAAWSGLQIDDLARLYDTEICVILDRLLPVQTVRVRRRPSDPWFDEACRRAKRQVRRLERVARKADVSDVTAATAAWTQQRRTYRDLLRQKRESFWKLKVEGERSKPH
jgi:hypothetical protein